MNYEQLRALLVEQCALHDDCAYAEWHVQDAVWQVWLEPDGVQLGIAHYADTNSALPETIWLNVSESRLAQIQAPLTGAPVIKRLPIAPLVVFQMGETLAVERAPLVWYVTLNAAWDVHRTFWQVLLALCGEEPIAIELFAPAYAQALYLQLNWHCAPAAWLTNAPGVMLPYDIESALLAALRKGDQRADATESDAGEGDLPF